MAFKRWLPILLLTVFALPARAEVARIEVSSRTELLGGKAFGEAGVFEIMGMSMPERVRASEAIFTIRASLRIKVPG